MADRASTYHQRVAAEKRAAILVAALRLFTESGYDRTSLVSVAEAADVSTATLFKQFPNKATLFQAIVVDYWTTDADTGPQPTPADPEQGLHVLGTRYASLLLRDGMAGLFRIVIAEAPRFPELAQIQFDLGKAPFFDSVRDYFQAQTAVGTLHVDDAVMAATQFLGMIANYVLWPRMLLVDWTLSPEQVSDAVNGAVATILARHRATHLGAAQAAIESATGSK